MYQSNRPSDRRHILLAGLRCRDISRIAGFGRRGRALGVALGVISGLMLPIGELGAKGPCDTYEPACGAGLCDCGKCGGHTEIFESARGCDHGCDACGSATTKLRNPLFSTLDTVAGGIEKALGLDRCKSTCGCSTPACDTASCDRCAIGPVEMVPAPVHAAPMKPRTAPRQVTPSLPSVPAMQPRAIDTTPRKVQPFEPRLVEPEAQPEIRPIPKTSQESRQIPTQPRQTRPVPEPEPALPIAPDSEPTPLPRPNVEPDSPFDNPLPPTPMPEPTAPKKESSPFDILDQELDNLDDPFKEDALNLRKPYRPIRPTGLRSSSHHRRQRDAAIGSGLRPVIGTAFLQPVSHEEPVSGLKPLGGGGKLAPYRGSK